VVFGFLRLSLSLSLLDSPFLGGLINYEVPFFCFVQDDWRGGGGEGMLFFHAKFESGCVVYGSVSGMSLQFAVICTILFDYVKWFSPCLAVEK